MDVPAERCAWLTTLRCDGSPHTTPVWFAIAGSTLWVASAEGNIKVRNIERDPRVSVAIDGTGARPYVALGRAFIRTDVTEVPSALDLLAQKYDGWDVQDRSVDGARVLIEIAVDRWLLSGE